LWGCGKCHGCLNPKSFSSCQSYEEGCYWDEVNLNDFVEITTQDPEEWYQNYYLGSWGEFYDPEDYPMDEYIEVQSFSVQEVVYVKKTDPNAIIPERKTDGAAGFDLRTIQTLEIPPGEAIWVETGLAFAIPDGYAGVIEARSSLATSGLVPEGGIIDSDYRGPVRILLHNFSKERKAYIYTGDRIAQMLVIPILKSPMQEVQELAQTT
jgi:dUTP pyrophosphatase